MGLIYNVLTIPTDPSPRTLRTRSRKVKTRRCQIYMHHSVHRYNYSSFFSFFHSGKCLPSSKSSSSACLGNGKQLVISRVSPCTSPSRTPCTMSPSLPPSSSQCLMIFNTTCMGKSNQITSQYTGVPCNFTPKMQPKK